MATYGKNMKPSASPASNKVEQSSSKEFFGVTSSDEKHFHEYRVDENGNGWALETTHPEQASISHKHEIKNWVIQSEKSNCYPNCGKMYGYIGAPPHTHETIQKNVLKEQAGRYAKYLPVADINKVTLEYTKSTALKSTVEFCIKQDSKSINQWVKDPNLRKNLKVKIIQSINPETTESLANDININTASNNSVSEFSDIDVNDIIGGVDALKNSNTMRFKRTFNIDVEGVRHLSYFIFVYLAASASDPQNGYVLFQKVIEKGKNTGGIVQDFRNFVNIKKTPIDLARSQKNPVEAESKIHSLKGDSVTPFRKPAYFSDIFLSRDRAGRSKFAFGVDFRKIIKDSSVFSALYEQSQAEDLLSLSKIQRFSVKRRRVTTTNTNNKLGSQRAGQIVYEKDSTIPDTILTTMDNDSQLKEINNDLGGIKELNLALNNATGVRFFSGYDTSIARLSDGIYQYGIEFVVEDKTKEYLSSLVDALSSDKRKMDEYHTSAILNYDSISNSLDSDFIERWRGKTESWKTPVVNYLNLLNIITSSKSSFSEKELLNMTAPERANPDSISATIKLIEDLISRLNMSMDSQSSSRGRKDKNREGRSHAGSGTNRITTHEHWFTNDQFDSGLSNNLGYDYLSIDAPNNIDDAGLKEISSTEYTNRVADEFNKFFSSISGKAMSTNWAFLSPSFCYFHDNDPNKIFDFTTSTKHEDYSVLAGNILSHNSIKHSGELVTSDNLKSAMTQFYSNVNLTITAPDGSDLIKPIAAVGVEHTDTPANPSELFASLSEELLKSGASNSTSTKNPFTSESRSYKVGDKEIKPDEDILAMWDKDSIENIVDKVANVRAALMPPIIQFKALIEGRNLNTSSNKTTRDDWQNIILKNSSALSYFYFRYSMINRVEVLHGFKTSAHDTRIKDLSWKPLTKKNLLEGGSAVICRMKSFELPIMGIKHPKGLKLPVYDNYFIIVY